MAVMTVIPKAKLIKSLVPDYLHDLNAMQKAEATLDWDDRKKMHRHLCTISRARPDFKQRPDIMETVWFVMSEATAAQRADAFLLTLVSSSLRGESPR
jgi:hypothetical protein